MLRGCYIHYRSDDDDLPVVNFTDGTGYTDAGDTESTIAENESSITTMFS